MNVPIALVIMVWFSQPTLLHNCILGHSNECPPVLHNQTRVITMCYQCVANSSHYLSHNQTRTHFWPLYHKCGGIRRMTFIIFFNTWTASTVTKHVPIFGHTLWTHFEHTVNTSCARSAYKDNVFTMCCQHAVNTSCARSAYKDKAQPIARASKIFLFRQVVSWEKKKGLNDISVPQVVSCVRVQNLGFRV